MGWFSDMLDEAADKRAIARKASSISLSEHPHDLQSTATCLGKRNDYLWFSYVRICLCHYTISTLCHRPVHVGELLPLA